MSVLVDERFGGSWDDLRAARAATDAAAAREGLLLDDRAPARGARRGRRRRPAHPARPRRRDGARADDAQPSALGLDTLVEAHDADELARAVALDAPVVGVNARDLGTFDVDRAAQLELVARAPRDRIVIAESGIETRAQAAAAELAGANAVLVGSTLMRAADPGAKLRELVQRPLVKVCGLTRQEDVDVAVDAGADLVGFILAAESPRRTDALLDAPDTVLRVAVFVGEEDGRPTPTSSSSTRARTATVRATPSLLRRGERVGSVVDLPWGETDPSHLERARATEGRVMLAGGLGPDNVRDAIAAVRPWAVDSARSTESSPGIKDHDAVRRWVEAARG